MIAGVSTFHALVRENPDLAFMGHPALTGPGYIAPPFLFGKLFRLFGADAVGVRQPWRALWLYAGHLHRAGPDGAGAAGRLEARGSRHRPAA